MSKKNPEPFNKYPLVVNVSIFAAIIQFVFIVLKLFNQLEWTWVAVLSPAIAYIGAWVILIITLVVICTIILYKDDTYI